MFAARNSALCTKDCVCLFICPTGATDTENGQIDEEKCIDGCRLCVDACPSHAIYLVHEKYPTKTRAPDEVQDLMYGLLVKNAGNYIKALAAAERAAPVGEAVYRSLALSKRILSEDCVREMGYMIPDVRAVRELVDSHVLENLYRDNYEDDNGESVRFILREILTALEEHRDAVPVEVLLCQDCGHIVLEEKTVKCPSCSSESLQSV
jgi:ferredoxin